MRVLVEDDCAYCHGRRCPPGQPLEKCSPCKGTGAKQRSISLEDFADLFVCATKQVKTSEGWGARNALRVADVADHASSIAKTDKRKDG